MPRPLMILLLLLCLPAVGSAAEKKAPTLSGSVMGYSESSDELLANARIELRPLAPLQGRDRRPADDLLGLALTDDEGRFSIVELNSASRRQAYPLMVGWSYLVKVVSPGHYVFNGVVNYYGESDPWEFMLEAKVTDVVDTSGTVAPEDRQLQHGATRRGDQ